MANRVSVLNWSIAYNTDRSLNLKIDLNADQLCDGTVNMYLGTYSYQCFDNAVGGTVFNRGIYTGMQTRAINDKFSIYIELTDLYYRTAFSYLKDHWYLAKDQHEFIHWATAGTEVQGINAPDITMVMASYAVPTFLSEKKSYKNNSMITEQEILKMAAGELSTNLDNLYVDVKVVPINNTGDNTLILGDGTSRKQFVFIKSLQVSVTTPGASYTGKFKYKTDIVYELIAALGGGHNIGDLIADSIDLSGTMKGEVIVYRVFAAK